MTAFARSAVAEPVALWFAPGSYGVLAQGRVTDTTYAQDFAFEARAGQTIFITFVGAGPMEGGISCEKGGDGPFQGSGNTFVVPADGQCVITVGANTRAEPKWKGGFTLAVLVK